MTQRSHGLFSGRSRHLARHNMPSKLGITKKIKHFEIGSKVQVMPKGNFRNIPHPRYRNKIATVVAKRGEAYEVEIAVGKTIKRRLIVPQIHLDYFSA